MHGLSQVSRFIEWEAYPDRDLEKAEALVIVKWMADRELSLALVEVPESHRLVLSRRNFFKEGVSILRISDDTSGWWIQLTETSTLKVKRVEDLARPPAVAEMFRGNELGVTLELEGLGWKAPFTVTSTLDEAGLYPNFFEQADFDGQAERILRGMSVSTRYALRAFVSLAPTKDRDGFFDVFPNLLNILTATLDRHDEHQVGLHYRGTEWKRTRATGTTGEELPDAELAFLGQFRSVPQEPMSLLCQPENGQSR